jgi:hypothetical protein
MRHSILIRVNNKTILKKSAARHTQGSYLSLGHARITKPPERNA